MAVYDLRRSAGRKQQEAARKVRRVMCDGREVPDCFFADTDAGVAMYYVRKNGSLVADEYSGRPVTMHVIGCVEVEFHA
jgi:hypothetical protein